MTIDDLGDLGVRYLVHRIGNRDRTEGAGRIPLQRVQQSVGVLEQPRLSPAFDAGVAAVLRVVWIATDPHDPTAIYVHHQGTAIGAETAGRDAVLIDVTVAVMALPIALALAQSPSARPW